MSNVQRVTDEPNSARTTGPAVREAIEMARMALEVQATQIIEAVELATGRPYEDGLVMLAALAEHHTRLQAKLTAFPGIAIEIDRQLALRHQTQPDLAAQRELAPLSPSTPTDPQWLAKYAWSAKRIHRTANLLQQRATREAANEQPDDAVNTYQELERTLKSYKESAGLTYPLCPADYAEGITRWHLGAIAGLDRDFATAEELHSEATALIANVAAEVDAG